jgi:hypothetical protein
MVGLVGEALMDLARARLRCLQCGEVEVDVAGVEVHVNPREDVAVFTFACPGCLELVVSGCRETITSLLAAGARRYELRSTSAPPLTHDDLLELHQWLERDEPWPQEPSPGR